MVQYGFNGAENTVNIHTIYCLVNALLQGIFMALVSCLIYRGNFLLTFTLFMGSKLLQTSDSRVQRSDPVCRVSVLFNCAAYLKLL